MGAVWRHFRAASRGVRWAQHVGSALQPTRRIGASNRCGADVESGMKSYPLEAHSAAITCLSLDDTTDMMCTADADGKLCIWSCNGRVLGKLGLKCLPVHLHIWSGRGLATDSSQRLHVLQLNQKGTGGGFTQIQIMRAAAPLQLDGAIKSATFLREHAQHDSIAVQLYCGSALWEV